FVPLVAEGRAPREALAMLACEELRIVPSDRRSFALLGVRFSESPAGEFFLGLAEAERHALGHLRDFARALGLDQHAIAAYRPQPGCQAYPSYVAWLALNGSRSDVALALIANLAAWGSFCAATATGLRARYGFDDQAVAFFDFFATPAPDFDQQALAVIEAGLRAGDLPQNARHAARMLQAYELMFWNTLAEGLA
ncbi:MAG: transcriptional regulator, partial [Actinomycetota bacterium]